MLRGKVRVVLFFSVMSVLYTPCHTESGKRFTHVFAGKKVNSGILESTLLSAKIECALKCLNHPSCETFSIGKINDINKYICELSSVSAMHLWGDIESAIDFHVYTGNVTQVSI